jgi:hypothetical protein
MTDDAFGTVEPTTYVPSGLADCPLAMRVPTL